MKLSVYVGRGKQGLWQRELTAGQHDFVPKLQALLANQSAGDVCKEIWECEDIIIFANDLDLTDMMLNSCFTEKIQETTHVWCLDSWDL